MNKRYIIAFILLALGLMFVVGTFGKYEFDGFIDPAEFIGKTVLGLAMMAAALPISGDLDELVEKGGDKHDTRRK